MRQTFIIALAAFVTLGWASDAHAGKKDKAATEEPAADDPGIEILVTEIPEVDAFFEKAKAPIDTITNTKNGLNKLNADLVTALGLAEGTPVSDALTDLKTKAGGKITVATEGVMPKLSVADGAPENVTNAVNALNNGFGELTGMVAGLKDLPAQFGALIAEGQKFADPNTLKGMASNPVVGAKAIPKVAKNLKALTEAKTEVEELVVSLDSLKAIVGTLAN